jgi:hypothetical protein
VCCPGELEAGVNHVEIKRILGRRLELGDYAVAAVHGVQVALGGRMDVRDGLRKVGLISRQHPAKKFCQW